MGIGLRWVVVVFRLASLWMRLHVPEERASGQDSSGSAAVAGATSSNGSNSSSNGSSERGEQRGGISNNTTQERSNCSSCLCA